jgi:hypothetical protein
MRDLWWTKWQWDKFVFKYLGFSASLSLHQCFIIIFILELVLSEGHGGESGEPSEKAMFSLRFRKLVFIITAEELTC